VFRYRLHSPDGDDLGEATYPRMLRVGDELFFASMTVGWASSSERAPR
jgi:hypothetical protein